ncbi:hypothetical protein [Kocuria sp. ZOR0020]|uniref:hypothetical protein n=1 Tax=Kocuria sp. ZOR0020 TaxID=1339234 RepID=UPI0006479BC9|nr:hypothetical protein [Kocuria sp. ZOR0020]
MDFLRDMGTTVAASLCVALILAWMRSLRHRMDDSGIGAAMERAQRRLEEVDHLEEWGEFKWAADERVSALRGPIRRMVRFELNRNHPGLFVLIVFTTAVYVFSLIGVMAASRGWIPWGVEYVYVAGLLGVLASFIMFVTWMVWRGIAEFRMQKEVRRRVDRAWVHLLFHADSDTRDTLAP